MNLSPFMSHHYSRQKRTYLTHSHVILINLLACFIIKKISVIHVCIFLLLSLTKCGCAERGDELIALLNFMLLYIMQCRSGWSQSNMSRSSDPTYILMFGRFKLRNRRNCRKHRNQAKIGKKGVGVTWPYLSLYLAHRKVWPTKLGLNFTSSLFLNILGRSG